MQRELICPVCNEKFTTNQNAQKYCSSKCRRKANTNSNKQSVREFSCAWCGNSFSSLRSKKYCSDECRLYANGRLKKKSKKSTKTVFTLNQVAFLSRIAGLSYGQYVNKFQLK